jgi:hypothetical protein
MEERELLFNASLVFFTYMSNLREREALRRVTRREGGRGVKCAACVREQVREREKVGGKRDGGVVESNRRIWEP